MDLVKIKKLRMAKGYSQRAFANLIGMTAQQYFRIEKGLSGTTMVTAEKIARGLDVDLAELLIEGKAAPGKINPDLERLAKQASALPAERVEAIKRMLEVMLSLSASAVVCLAADLLQMISRTLDVMRAVLVVLPGLGIKLQMLPPPRFSIRQLGITGKICRI